MSAVSRHTTQWLIAGTTAGMLSAAFAMAGSAARRREPTEPINAVSHIAYGGPPPASKGKNGVNTLLGLGVHLGASLFWSAVYGLLFAHPGSPAGRVVAASAGTAALAYVVDYRVVNERFRPGFEAHLSDRALFGVYASFALGLALGECLSRKTQRDHAYA